MDPEQYDKLRKGSNRLWYEICMFNNLVNRIERGIPENDDVIWYALIESFAIHVRALYHFFYDKKGQPDDINAYNYFINDPNCWTNSRPPITEVLLNVKVKADKEIAHISFCRLDITPEEKRWVIMPIYNDLILVIDKFKEKVPKELLGERWNIIDPIKFLL